MNKNFSKFIEEAANSVKKDPEEKIPNCPEGQYYDRKLKKCVMMAPRYGGRFRGIHSLGDSIKTKPNFIKSIWFK